jgi:hypothetical protein
MRYQLKFYSARPARNCPLSFSFISCERAALTKPSSINFWSAVICPWRGVFSSLSFNGKSVGADEGDLISSAYGQQTVSALELFQNFERRDPKWDQAFHAFSCFETCASTSSTPHRYVHWVIGSDQLLCYMSAASCICLSRGAVVTRINSDSLGLNVFALFTSA